jgi:predicted nucleotidyltransferase
VSIEPLLDVGKDELAIVKALLVRHVPDATVWVFGSRVKGTAKKFSDLDLCIKADQALGLEATSALAQAFSESDLPWKVDIVDWWSVNDGFKAIIDRDKVLLSNLARKT